MAAKNIILKGGSNYLNIRPSDDLTLKTAQKDPLGNSIYKYSQTYNDVPVFGRELVVQINTQDEVSMIGGQYEPSIELNTIPQLGAEDALNSALSLLDERPLDSPNIIEPSQLIIYVNQNIEPVLTYRAVIEYHTNESGYHKEQIFVDANSGKAVNQITLLHAAFNSSIYTLNNQCFSERNQSVLPGTEISPNSDVHAQGTHNNSIHAYYFYKHMFGRDSWDGNGRKIVSTVHIRFSDMNNQCHSDNAFFTGSQLLFGDGDRIYSNPGSSIDVFGHEYSHGFTSSSSNLTYQNESGAINEAISDIMGAGLSVWKNSGGSENGNPTNFNPTESDWTIAEDAALIAQAKRYLNDPAANGDSIDNYNTRNTGSADAGGVHSNSGIMNLAFYLLSEGGKHPRNTTNTDVTGIGIEKSLQIYYYANNNLFTQSTNFRDARGKLAVAAKTLYGCNEWESVHLSFDAVNIPGSRSNECNNNNPVPETESDPSAPTPTPGPTTAPNIAIGSAFRASSSNYFAPVQNATDNNTSSLWISKFHSYDRDFFNQETILLDLGSNQSFNSLSIAWSGSDSAKNIAVWVWKNGQWSEVANSSSANVEFSTQQAQHIGLIMSGGSDGKWYAIREITIK